MSVDVIDLVDLAHQEMRRKNIFNTPRFHAWMHYYKPGQKDEMHCHNADQTFYVIEGECTMRFPDGGQVVLKPGQAALITGGSFYQLENAGSEPMIMMGNRSGPAEKFRSSATRHVKIFASRFKPISIPDIFYRGRARCRAFRP
jgi:mannose-6-phosphate isomerase-like protein (cupin superfamily)